MILINITYRNLLPNPPPNLVKVGNIRLLLSFTTLQKSLKKNFNFFRLFFKVLLTFRRKSDIIRIEKEKKEKKERRLFQFSFLSLSEIYFKEEYLMKKVFRTRLSIRFRGRDYYQDQISVKKSINENGSIGVRFYYDGQYIGSYHEETDKGLLEEIDRIRQEEKELNKEFDNVYNQRLDYIRKIIDDINAYHFEEDIEDFEIKSFGIGSEDGYIQMSPITNDILWEQIDEILGEYEDETHKLRLEDFPDEKDDIYSFINIDFKDGYSLRKL